MKNVFIRTVFFLILFLSLSVCVHHNFVFAEDDTDLFKKMEDENDNSENTEENDENKKSGLLMKIAENLDGSVKLRYQYFPETARERAGLDEMQHFGEGAFELSTWTGNDTIQLHTTCYAQGGTQEDSYQGYVKWLQDKENYRRYFDCNELYFLFLTDLIDVTIGKKIFNTGISTLYSPSDRFRPSDYHDPIDPQQFGIWQGKIDFTIDRGAFTFMVIPVYTENKFPVSASRWWGERNIDLSGTGVDIENINQDIELENVDIFGKYDKTIAGWDFFVSMNSGPNPYDVIKQVGINTYVMTKNRIYSLAAGFSTTAGSLEYHGETLYNYSEGQKDDDYISSVIGVTCTIDDRAKYFMMEQIVVTVEYALEKKLRNQNAADYVLSSQEGRVGRNDLLLKMDLKYNEDLTFILAANVDFKTESWMNNFEVKYKIIDGLTWSIACQLFSSYSSGDEEYESTSFESVGFGDWDSNDRFVTYLKYSF